MQKTLYIKTIHDAEKELGVSKDDDAPLNPDDSSTPPPPPKTHVHHIRLGIFQMRVARFYLKTVERILNGGMTDEEKVQAEEAEKADKELQVEKANNLLANVMGGAGGGGKKKNEGSEERESENENENDDDTVATSESHTDRERRKDQERSLKITPYKKTAGEWLSRAIVSFNLAEELCIQAKVLGNGSEIYYNRAVCYYELSDAAACIKDLNHAVMLQPLNIPALLLRSKARIILGQYPQGRRDCMKVLNRFDPEHKEAEELKEECDEAVERLSKANVCDPELERTYEVHGDGVLTRDRVELRKLGHVGRSQKRERLEVFGRRKKMTEEGRKKHDEERKDEVVHAHSRASIAKKKLEKAKAMRAQCVKDRIRIEKIQREEMAKRQHEKKRLVEKAKEETECELMMAEEELTRKFFKETVLDVADDAKFEEENNDEMEALLAAAGRGGKKKKNVDDDKPWLVKGGKKKKKGGKE